MRDYREKCKRCHNDGLRNDEECCYYGEPNGCNHPNHGYGVIVDKYEALQKENDELSECLKEAIQWLKYVSAEVVGNEPERQINELVIKMRSALEGGNHAND